MRYEQVTSRKRDAISLLFGRDVTFFRTSKDDTSAKAETNVQPNDARLGEIAWAKDGFF